MTKKKQKSIRNSAKNGNGATFSDILKHPIIEQIWRECTKVIEVEDVTYPVGNKYHAVSLWRGRLFEPVVDDRDAMTDLTLMGMNRALKNS